MSLHLTCRVYWVQEALLPNTKETEAQQLILPDKGHPAPQRSPLKRPLRSLTLPTPKFS